VLGALDNSRVNVGLVGPMLGRNPGRVVSQGEVVAGLLEAEGHDVRVTSTVSTRVRRALDMVTSLRSWRGQVDVIVIEVFSGPSFGLADIASLIAKRSRVPLVLLLAGGSLPGFSERHASWIRRVLTRADVLVAPSPFLARAFQRHGYSVEVVPNTLPLDTYDVRIRHRVKPRMLWMRTFEHLYNPEMAVDVAAMVRRSHPSTIVTMAGQAGERLESTKQLAKDRGVSECVRFPGFLSPDAKRRELADHDIFLHTNRVDNTPVSLLEAAASGLPIIATRVGGIPFLLEHEKTALLVEDDDAVGMAEAVRRLLEDQELATTLSVNGRRLAERSFRSNMTHMWEAILERALGRTWGQAFE
jgi:glycosyltransferase involved in cell wall biosynthesis